MFCERLGSIALHRIGSVIAHVLFCVFLLLEWVCVQCFKTDKNGVFFISQCCCFCRCFESLASDILCSQRLAMSCMSFCFFFVARILSVLTRNTMMCMCPLFFVFSPCIFLGIAPSFVTTPAFSNRLLRVLCELCYAWSLRALSRVVWKLFVFVVLFIVGAAFFPPLRDG